MNERAKTSESTVSYGYAYFDYTYVDILQRSAQWYVNR